MFDTGTRLIGGVSVLHRSLVMISDARTLLIEGMSRCPTRVVSDTDTCMLFFQNFIDVDVFVFVSTL